jgi:enoyl-CoA hydratase
LAASMPRPLSQRAKQTLATMPTVTTHDAAVDTELEAQVWSTQQPFFAERLAALKAKISKR